MGLGSRHNRIAPRSPGTGGRTASIQVSRSPSRRSSVGIRDERQRELAQQHLARRHRCSVAPQRERRCFAVGGSIARSTSRRAAQGQPQSCARRRATPLRRLRRGAKSRRRTAGSRRRRAARRRAPRAGGRPRPAHRAASAPRARTASRMRASSSGSRARQILVLGRIVCEVVELLGCARTRLPPSSIEPPVAAPQIGPAARAHDAYVLPLHERRSLGLLLAAPQGRQRAAARARPRRNAEQARESSARGRRSSPAAPIVVFGHRARHAHRRAARAAARRSPTSRDGAASVDASASTV